MPILVHASADRNLLFRHFHPIISLVTKIVFPKRSVYMKKIEIRLSLAENVKTFVNTVNKYDFDMDLRAGRHVVDAKSILGIFSLDLSRPITLEVDDTQLDEAKLESLMEDIKAFVAPESV